jgi:hypothetical protein
LKSALGAALGTIFFLGAHRRILPAAFSVLKPSHAIPKALGNIDATCTSIGLRFPADKTFE